MKRKIVQHGSSSLTITIPIKWAARYNLKKGDELEVDEEGPTLKVTTRQEIASPRKIVHVTESGVFTKSDLSHLYHLGYDELEITSDDPETLDEIKARIPNCIGYEIIDQKDNTVYVRSIATTLDSEFDTLLRKSFQITNEMAKGILDALQQGNFLKLRELQSLESINNKFTDVCTRILNKKGYKVPQRSMQVYEVVKNIERIADEFKYICDLYSSCRKKPDKHLISCLKQAVSYYLAFYEMFYKFDPELKKRIYSERNTLIKDFCSRLEKSRGKDAVLLHYLINIVNKTFEGAGGYFALVL